MLKLWLDDKRNAPDNSWIVARSVPEARLWLMGKDFEVLSLDHDLGTKETGYTLLCWIEDAIFRGQWTRTLPMFEIHSANLVGRMRMGLAIHSIERMAAGTRLRG